MIFDCILIFLVVMYITSLMFLWYHFSWKTYDNDISDEKKVVTVLFSSTIIMMILNVLYDITDEILSVYKSFF